MKTMFFWGLALAVLGLLTIPLSAQPVVSAKSGTIAWVEGKVFLGDQAVEPSLTHFPDIKENVIVKTEAGRVEVLLPPGVVMHMGENSSFRMIDKRLIDSRLELISGAAVIDAMELERDTHVTVVYKEAIIALNKTGTYRFDTEPARLKVFAGSADVQIGENHIEVSGGRMLSLGGEVASVEKFDKDDTDALDNWAQRRNTLMAMANVSAARSLAQSARGSLGAGLWGFNPYFGMYTYIPYNGRFCTSFSHLCYWSPATVGRVYYQPPPPAFGGGFGGWSGPSYPTMGSTSGGYSGTISSAGSSSAPAAPAAAASSGSSAASSAGTSSVGQGSGASGGRGR